MCKMGAIDIGTNSMRVLMAKVKNGSIIESFKDIDTTRMGENVDKTGELSMAAMDRNVVALKKFMNRLEGEGLKQVPIIATSAVRDAKNKEVFLNRVKEELDFQIEVVSGDREAQLGFLGVMKGSKEKNENILVLDIGGGSTEFIFGNVDGIEYLVSLNVGAVRMTEKFINTDPISNKELAEMIKEIDRIIAPTIHRLSQFKIHRIVGIGGTATTIAAVSKELEVYDSEKIHNLDLKHDEIKRILHCFISKDLEERKEMAGLQPKRADIITAGAVILDRILKSLEVDGIRISEYDNLEGMVFEQLKNKTH